MPAVNPVIVLVAVDPVMAPGFIVQFPVGRPLRTTLPVPVSQVGWVIVPTVGAAGAPGTALIITSSDAGEVHPAALDTLYIYVPEISPDIVVVVPDPVVVIPPGFLVKVHVPEAGNPLKATLPVPTVQVGWVIVPMTGAAGAPGAASITTLTDCAEVHHASFVSE